MEVVGRRCRTRRVRINSTRFIRRWCTNVGLGGGECVYVIFERTSFDWFGAFGAHLIGPACGERKDKYNAQRVSAGGRRQTCISPCSRGYYFDAKKRHWVCVGGEVRVKGSKPYG